MNSIDLLHPELLPAETLLQILLERKVKIEGVESMMKEQLLEIYVKFCLPRTQRKSRDSGKNKVSHQHDNASHNYENNSKPVFKCDTINESNEDNAMMECDKFPPVKQKFSCNDSAGTEDFSQNNVFSLKRKVQRDVSKFHFDSHVKRQRTHTG